MAHVKFSAPMTVLFFGLFIRYNLISNNLVDTISLIPANQYLIKPQTISSPSFEAFSVSSQNYQRRAAIFAGKPRSSLLLNLILLCGDININPGTAWKYPCGLCKKPVKCNQLGLQCDSCDSWLHVRCLEMNIDDYENLANSSCSWICPNCDLPNFSTTLLDSSTGSIVLCNSFDILSTNCTQTTSGTPRGNMNCTNVPKPDKSSKRNKLRGMIINCNGLKSLEHSNYFQALLELHDPDFVLGTESKLHPGIPTYSIFPSTYTVFRKDRNGYGGGVFQAIKSYLICIEEPELNNDNCEIL